VYLQEPRYGVVTIFVLIALVWNGGVAPDGVLNRTQTFATYLECHIERLALEAEIARTFPGQPFLVYCDEQTFPMEEV